MSALGQKQTFAAQNVMSALPPKADMCVHCGCPLCANSGHGHAARGTRVSISFRSSEKSIGLVSSASAPFAKAFCLAPRAIDGDHNHRNVGSQGLCFRQHFETGHPRHIDVGQDQDD